MILTISQLLKTEASSQVREKPAFFSLNHYSHAKEMGQKESEFVK